MENKEKSKSLTTLLVILLISLTASIGYIFYDKIIRDKNISKNDTTIKEENDNKQEERISTDVSLNNDLTQKVKQLELFFSIKGNDGKYYNSLFPGIESKYRGWDIYIKNITNDDISPDVKLYNVLEKLYYENLGKSPVTTNYDFKELGYDKEVIDVQLDVSLVESQYRALYGSSTFSHKNFGFCPTFIYDSINLKYYGSAQCGGVSEWIIDTYINKITTTSDKAYAYVSLASIYWPEEKVYTNYESTILYTGEVGNIYKDIINEENYEQFSEYKYTFTKDGENYHFESIEKIS